MGTDVLLDYLTPESLGLDPVKFPSFRQVQLEAIEKVSFSDKRFVGICAPTGCGKELIAMGLARFSGRRTIILTHTRGLQDQYKKSHEKFGLVDIRGKDNYQCGELADGSCKDGMEEGCGLTRGHGCGYETQKVKAIKAWDVISNYNYWMSVNDKGQGLGDVDIDLETGEITGGVEQLVLDEAHESGDALSDYLGFQLYEKEMSKWVDVVTVGDQLVAWIELAKNVREELRAEIRTMKMELDHYKSFSNPMKRKKIREEIKRTKNLYDRVYRLSSAETDEWVCEQRIGTQWGRIWKFDIISPHRYAERYLHCGTPKIVYMGATLRPQTMYRNGIKKDDMDFFEWPRQFPANRNPMYFYPAIKNGKQVRISRNSTEEELKLWVEHNDKVIDLFLDRRVVMVTTSYAYQKYFIDHSRHGKIMIGNTQDPESDTAQEIFDKFIRRKPPVVLVSPSFGTGWNFKYDYAEVVLAPKVPWTVPGSASKLWAARLARDPEYGIQDTVQTIVQWSGRPMRAEDDRGMFIITDGSFSRLMGDQGRRLAPRGWVDGVKRVNEIKPMEKL